jgi:hypothetical protein
VELIHGIVENEGLQELMQLIDIYENNGLVFPAGWMNIIAWEGDLEKIELILDHFPVTAGMVTAAMNRGSVHMLELIYMKENVLPTAEDISEVNKRSNDPSTGDMIKQAIIWALQHGVVPSTEDIPYMADDVLEFISQYDYDFDETYFDQLSMTADHDWYIEQQLNKLRQLGIWHHE